MKKIFVLITFISLSIYSFSQQEQADKILKEGQLLFRLEKASWNATDHFMANFENQSDQIGGYVSYISGNNVNTIFWSKFDSTELLVRYVFDSLPGIEPKEFFLSQTATQEEIDLINLRNDAINRVYYENDDYFLFYENTSLNFIPLITRKERKVYIVTGPQSSGYVLLGNDYLLTYNKKNKFTAKSKIHNSLIQLPEKGGDSEITQTIHSHVVTELITATDICTLLLYRDFTEWKHHYVMGKKYVSIFDMEKETIAIMKRTAFEKPSKNE